MEIDKVFKLIDAGFTKDEILALTKDPEEKPEEKPEEAASPAEQKPASAPAEEKKPEEQQPSEMELLRKELEGIREDLRKRALLEDGFRPQDSRAAAEDVLASIINPPLQSKMKGKKD